jgi:hypothetical protein
VPKRATQRAPAALTKEGKATPSPKG